MLYAVLACARCCDGREQEFNVQAAKYEVFVTQPPDQDPQRCFERNVHGRTAQDVLEASRSLEPSLPTVSQLNCASIVPNSAPDTDSQNPPLPSDCATPIEDCTHSIETKRKSMDVASVGGGEEKRARMGDGTVVIDDSAVLAMVDAGFSKGGASEGAKKPQKQGNRSRWSDDDDSEEESGSRWQVRSAQNSQQQLGGAAGTSGGVGAFSLPFLETSVLSALSSVHEYSQCFRY